MKKLLSKLNPHYIINEYGKKTHIILDVAVFEKFLTEIEDFYFGMMACKALSKEENIILHDDVKKSLM